METISKKVKIYFKMFENVASLKQEIKNSFNIFDTDIYFTNCAFLFTDNKEVLQKIIFGILDSILMDCKIGKLDFVEATINKEKRDEKGNFIFVDKAKIDLHLVRCYIGTREDFMEKYNHLENLE
jgi:hypothetical protein